MRLLIVAALLLTTACTSVPPVKPVSTVNASDCRPVQGAPVRMTRDGQQAHKYICSGVGVWAVTL